MHQHRLSNWTFRIEAYELDQAVTGMLPEMPPRAIASGRVRSMVASLDSKFGPCTQLLTAA